MSGRRCRPGFLSVRSMAFWYNSGVLIITRHFPYGKEFSLPVLRAIMVVGGPATRPSTIVFIGCGVCLVAWTRGVFRSLVAGAFGVLVVRGRMEIERPGLTGDPQGTGRGAGEAGCPMWLFWLSFRAVFCQVFDAGLRYVWKCSRRGRGRGYNGNRFKCTMYSSMENCR